MQLEHVLDLIAKDKLLIEEMYDRQNEIVKIKKLEGSKLFFKQVGDYVKTGALQSALEILQAMIKRGSNESSLLNDYGGLLARQTLEGEEMDKEKLLEARKYIFEAYEFDRKTTRDWYTFPAYKNLCYLRAAEANHYRKQKDTFAAFVLGFVSIEMTIYRLWHQYLRLKSAKKIEELMRWNLDSIIRVLCLGEVSEPPFAADLDTLKQSAEQLTMLKATRDDLLHGKKSDPTGGEVDQCIRTALKLVPLFQHVKRDAQSNSDRTSLEP